MKRKYIAAMFAVRNESRNRDVLETYVAVLIPNEISAKKFFHKSSLSMHMKYHLKARFTCEVCKKAFSQLCDYKVHYRIHSGEKPVGFFL